METKLRHNHKIGRKQSWSSVDQDVREFIESLVETISIKLEPVGFVGAYLHGSLTFGSFYRPKSDIDILFVIEESMPKELRRGAAIALCDYSDKRPIVGDIEVSVVRQTATLNFQHPLPYELHYGEDHKQKIRDEFYDFETNHEDFDLAVYCHVIRGTGVCLKGKPIEDVFGAVPLELYQNSILGDLEWILDDDNIVSTPFYAVLNCCRVLEAKTNAWRKVLSKEEGGEWALANLPSEYHPIILQALTCYRSAEEVLPSERRTDGHDWDWNGLRVFRDFVKQKSSMLDS